LTIPKTFLIQHGRGIMNPSEASQFPENISDIPNIAEAAKNAEVKAEDLTQRVAHQVSEKASEINQSVRDAANRAGRAMNEGYKKVIGKSRHTYQQSRDAAGRWEKKIQKNVRSYPYSSLLIAAGLGFLAGVCVHRESRR
jgi:ElaB/YqjD/DUF883 family membrane-anchored ribosome-binding protein